MVRIFVTDLDGTLLDHRTYSWAPARPALELLKKRNIPLILSSSKTATEVIPLREAIGNEHPFIVENGGGIYIPEKYFRTICAEYPRQDGFLVIPLGPTCSRLRRALQEIALALDLKVRSFDDLSERELAQETGLATAETARAKKREFDLPFRIETADCDITLLEKVVQERGLRLNRGGRYLHLSGRADKGTAVRRLSELYRQETAAPVEVVGLGDSHNDLEMLHTADIPVVIPNPWSDAALTDDIPWAIRAPEPGPAGWNAIVLSLCESR